MCPDTQKVLLLRRQDGFWGVPGGFADYGETPPETAIREVWEETGIRLYLEDIQPLANRNGFVCFRALVWETPILLSHEHENYVWADLHNLPKPLMRGNLQLVLDATRL